MFPWTKYPYTNFQELNLDYLLAEMRRLSTRVDSISSSVEISPAYPCLADLLEDTDIVTGAYAQTIAYHAGTMKGGAIYQIVDTAPATYYETMSDGRYAKLIYNAQVDVTQFGAYGDNFHDDRAAFQSAINTGAEVVVPVDQDIIYRINGILTIGATGTDCIRGNFKSLFGRIHFDTGYFHVTRYACRFENLFIEGAASDDYNSYLIKVEHAVGRYDCDFSMINCTLRWADLGVYVDGRGLEVYDCVFSTMERAIHFNYTGSGSDGTLNSTELGGRGLRVYNNRLHSTTNSVIQLTGSACGIQILNNYVDNCAILLDSSADIYGGKIASNNCLLFGSTYLNFTGDTNDLLISENTFTAYRDLMTWSNPTSFLIFSGGDHKQLAITNNTFEGCTLHPINASGTGCTFENVQICNNTFTNVDKSNETAAVFFTREVKQLLISGNVVDGSSSLYIVYFLDEADSSDVVVTDNINRAGRTSSTMLITRSIIDNNIDQNTV